MSWNIRVMRHKSTIKDVDDWYALHEVYYNDKGQVCMWTEDPIEMVGIDLQDLLSYLIMSLRDFWRSRHDILDFDMKSEGVPDWLSEDGSMKTREEDLIVDHLSNT